MNIGKRVTACFWGICACAITSESFSQNNNPASVDYVDQAIQNLRKDTTYTAGTGISILNNIISGTYTGTNGVTVSGSTISGAYTAGTGIAISSGAEISVTPTYSVGDIAQGGIVVYVDATGQHGLVATPTNVLTDITATNGYVDPTSTITTFFGASRDGMYGGYQNTVAAVGVIGALEQLGGTTQNDSGVIPGGALSYVANASGGACTQGSSTNTCLGGWYVPNVAELFIINNALCNTDYHLTTGTKYWSSTSLPMTYSNPPQPGYQYVGTAPGYQFVLTAGPSGSSSCALTSVADAFQEELFTTIGPQVRLARQF